MCDDDVGRFGFAGDPADDAMMAAADALRDRNVGAARVALAEAERWKPTAQLAFEAQSLLDAGRPDEAARRIDLFLHPKFDTLATCREAYETAMRGQGEFILEADQ